ncbi:MAG: hypothetical protein LBN95_03620, partial [Prevotellaceae bacterium]|nr:hypothetical protein [Prevotellaceae bacterium]
MKHTVQKMLCATLFLCACAGNSFSNSIVLTSTPPTIDGTIDAVWNNVPTFTIDKVTSVGTPTNNPAGTWRVMSDNANFYYLIEVIDNNKWGNATANNYWNGDAVEIYIASDNGNTANQIGFGYVVNTAVMRRYGKTDTGGSFYMKDTPTGYLLEASLPLSYFGISNLTVSSTVKMELGINQGNSTANIRVAQINTFSNSVDHRLNTNNYGVVPIFSDVTISSSGRTNLFTNGSNFAALRVSSTNSTLGSVSSYLWQVKSVGGADFVTYTGKNYNNNNIRPSMAGTYRCKIVFAGNAAAYYSNEIIITANAAPTSNYLNGNLTSNLPIIVVNTGNNNFPNPQGGCSQISGSGYADKTKIDVDVKILWNENGNNNSIVAMANNASVYYDRKAVMNYRGS